MKIERLKINEIKPYKNNAKEHPQEQIEQIIQSIEQFGMNDPIAIWGNDNIVVEGHGRLEALKQMGETEVDVIRLDHLTDEERKAYSLVHNKLTMNTNFDDEVLQIELNDLKENFNMFAFGFDDVKIQEGEEEAKERPQVKFSEVLEEENNYLVLFFDNDIDWIQALSLFDVKTVKALSTKKKGESIERKGVGRVLNGREALSKLVDWGV